MSNIVELSDDSIRRLAQEINRVRIEALENFYAFRDGLTIEEYRAQQMTEAKRAAERREKRRAEKAAQQEQEAKLLGRLEELQKTEITQRGMAETLGISQSMVSRLLRKRGVPPGGDSEITTDTAST